MVRIVIDVNPWLPQGNANEETSVAGLRFHFDAAVMFLNDAHDGVEAEAGAFANGLGGEEGIEDARFDFRRNAWAVVADLDANGVKVAAGTDAEFALAVHGVDSVVDEIGPNLVEFAPESADAREIGSVVARNGYALLQP